MTVPFQDCQAALLRLVTQLPPSTQAVHGVDTDYVIPEHTSSSPTSPASGH